MVLESIIPPEKVEQNVAWAFPLGFLLTVVGLGIGLWLFPEDASIVGILFITAASIPFLRGLLTIEEEIDEEAHAVIQFLQRNEKVIKIYFMLFLGIVCGYILFYYLLPAGIVSKLFSKQLALFPGAAPTGQFLGAHSQLFFEIVVNNFKVALIALALSFIYGAGSIMILTWNASALAIFLVSLGSITSVAFSLPHALFEFGGFFIAAVAGGLISIAAERDNLFSEQFMDILFDGSVLFILGLLAIVFAALLEVTVGVLA